MRGTFIRNTVFGVEDGLVSTVGLLAGIAVAGVPKTTVFLTGVIYIAVEGFSMAVGSILSEHSGMEAEAQREIPLARVYGNGFVMFFSFCAAGLVPLLPYVFLGEGLAFAVSIALSLIALFILGIVGAKVAGIPLLKQASQMLILGGSAILLGVIVGKLLGVK
jgi:VIT1/CCC1 family predicted Fe2+/Mn2+ transporter